nr:hypothetical protein [Tanacetum cinerariifolium]
MRYFKVFYALLSARLLVETPENSFSAPVNIEIIKAFMNKVGYQGVVDKVSAFYIKNLTQPWQTMIKVFNHCLTTRTSRHDQTKINILQLFHAMINRANVDYAALLWLDFMNNVFQKKEAIQYPRFIKFIIDNLMKKFLNIPQRIDQDYHSIKDNIPLEIRATNDFKEYEMVFMNVDVLMKQRQPVVSTHGMHISPKKLLKITIRQQKVVEGEKDDDDSKDRLEPESHKKNPEHVDDNDDKHEEKVDEEEGGALHRMCRRQGYMIPNMERKRVTTKYFWKTHKKVDQVLHEEWDAWVDEIVIDEDEVILEDETHELITKRQNVDKHVTTIIYRARMEATLNDMLSNQFKNAEEEIKKVNEKVYAAQVGCELCKGPHYTKDCPLKEEGLGELAHTKLTLELVDRLVKHPKGIAENVLVGIELRRNQGDDLMPTIKEDEVIEKPMIEKVKTRNDDNTFSKIIRYPSGYDEDEKIHIGYAYNLMFSCMIVIEDVDSYLDERMGDIVVGEPFCKASCVEASRFDGIITICVKDDNVTYQIVRSNPRFKHLTNE